MDGLRGGTWPPGGSLRRLHSEHRIRREREECKAAALDALCRALEPWGNGLAVAEAVALRVHPASLDLTGLTPEELHCVQNMGEDAWQALQDLSLAIHGLGLQTVTLSTGIVLDDKVLAGLRRLPVTDLYMAYDPAEHHELETWLKERLPTLEHLWPRFAPAQQANLRAPMAMTPHLPPEDYDGAAADLSDFDESFSPLPSPRAPESKADLFQERRAALVFLDEAMRANNGPAAAHGVAAVLELADQQPLMDVTQDLIAMVRIAAWKGCAGALAGFVPAVLEANSLSPQQRFDVLMGDPQNPLLANLCDMAKLPGPMPQLRKGQLDAIYTIVTQVMESPGMSDPHKMSFCAALQSRGDHTLSCAQAALKHRYPWAAASVMAPVLESSLASPVLKSAILALLGVDTASVVADLSRLVDPIDVDWTNTMIERLWAGHTALQLMQGDRLVTLLGEEDACRAAELRAEACGTTESGEGFLLCSAKQEMPGLMPVPPEEAAAHLSADRPYAYALAPLLLGKAGPPSDGQ